MIFTASSSRASNLRIALLTVLIFFLMRPGMVAFLQSGSYVLECFNALRWCAILVSAGIYIRLVRIDAFGIAVLGLAVFSFSSLLVNGVELYYFTEFWLPCCAMALLARALGGEGGAEIVWAMLIASSIISIGNLISVFVFPSGIPAAGYRYFNGNKNSAIIAIIPSVFCSLMLDAREKRVASIRSIALIAVGFVQVLGNEFTYSATSIVVLCIAVLGAAVLINGKAQRVLNGYTYLGGYVVAFFGIVVFRMQNVFAFFIEDVLGKSLTFTDRTLIWDQAIGNVLSKNVLIGCGNDMYDAPGYVVGTAHNMVLETFVQGGILGVFSLAVIVFLAARSLCENRSSRVAALAALAIGCFLMIGLMEHIRFPAFFFFLGLAASWKGCACEQDEGEGSNGGNVQPTAL